MTDREKHQLDDLGYIALEGFMSDRLLADLRERVDELFLAEGAQAGSEFKQEPGARRLANLVDKGAVFADAIAIPAIVERVGHVLGPDFKLSSLNVRSANPRSDAAQPLHADMGAVADDRGYWVCNTVWMLDDFTESNGALRIVPGSHKWGRLPEAGAAEPTEELITGRAGTVVVMNAHMWHGGTANRTERERRAMHGFYCRGDKPQQQYQKRLLRPETLAGLSPALRKLLAIDDERNDVLSAQGSGKSGFMK